MVSFILVFPPISYIHSSSTPIRATRPAHLVLLDLIILCTLQEEYKLWSSSLCSFLQPPVSSSLFGPNILNALFIITNIEKRSKFWEELIVYFPSTTNAVFDMTLFRGCNVGITDNDLLSMPVRVPQVAWYSKFHEDRLNQWSNIKVITSTIWEAVV
jgi:hypothetical protein